MATGRTEAAPDVIIAIFARRRLPFRRDTDRRVVDTHFKGRFFSRFFVGVAAAENGPIFQYLTTLNTKPPLLLRFQREEGGQNHDRGLWNATKTTTTTTR